MATPPGRGFSLPAIPPGRNSGRGMKQPRAGARFQTLVEPVRAGNENWRVFLQFTHGLRLRLVQPMVQGEFLNFVGGEEEREVVIVKSLPLLWLWESFENLTYLVNKFVDNIHGYFSTLKQLP
jgi:hypothetical protein